MAHKSADRAIDGNALDRVEEAQRAAKCAENRLREAIDVLPEGIVFLDAEGRYILWNQKYSEIYAKSADLLERGVCLADTLRIGVERGDYPEAEGREEEWLAERLALLDNPGVRHEQQLSNGRCIMIEERKTASGGTIGLRVDITEMKEREKSFRLLFEDNPVPLLVFDPESGLIESANEAALQYFGYDASEMAGLPAELIFAAEDWGEARAALEISGDNSNRFWRHRTKDGSHLESVLFVRRSVFQGRQVSIVSIFDVTERRRAEARLAHMALHDELTGLANRAQCGERLNELLSADNRQPLTIAMVDLDNFKAINDTCGHQVGDQVLATAALRMTRVLPDDALLCRIGGDEFAIIFPGVDDKRLSQCCKAIIASIGEPFSVDEHHLHAGATIGLASAPDDSNDPETLIRYADLSLYAAKRQRRGTVVRFDPSLDIAAREKARLEHDFREAVSRGELTVNYQPLICLSTGEVDGYEALLRWAHAERGNVSPEIFIPLAEELGLIDMVGQYVLQTACREAAGWEDGQRLAVNVSPVQFRSGQLLNIIVQALAASGLPPERLEIEITEAVLMDKEQETFSVIHSIREMGVGVSMDDFGTGYSSLSYLLRYPFTKVKIDKSFVMDLMRDQDSQAIIRAVIGLGRSLGLSVTAEGIEDEDVLGYLREEGCTQGQGYLFGKARPASEIFAPESKRKKA